MARARSQVLYRGCRKDAQLCCMLPLRFVIRCAGASPGGVSVGELGIPAGPTARPRLLFVPGMQEARRNATAETIHAASWFGRHSGYL
jgi:hypothetical protein